MHALLESRDNREVIKSFSMLLYVELTEHLQRLHWSKLIVLEWDREDKTLKQGKVHCCLFCSLVHHRVAVNINSLITGYRTALSAQSVENLLQRDQKEINSLSNS